MKNRPDFVATRGNTFAHLLPALALLLALPGVADAAVLSGWFRHSSANLYINIGESYQSSATGPLLDEQPQVAPPVILPPIFGRYRVDYGVIGVYATNDGTAPLPTTGIICSNAGTTAGFQDTFTMSAAGVPFYSAGSMDVRIDIQGTLAASGRSSASYILDIAVGQQCCGQLDGTLYGPDWNIGGGSIVGSDFGSYIFNVPIVFGLQDTLSMVGHADATDYEGPGSSTADLYSSFRWGGVLAVYGPDGTPVTNFQMVSQSGYDYATVVPLPPTVWLLLTGLGALVARRFHRRR